MKLSELTHEDSQEIVKMILDAGYKAYMHEPKDQHCFVTDGTHIGYCQWSGYMPSTSTVHIPSTQTGTGYKIADQVNIETIEAAMFTFAPAWASRHDRDYIVKYRNWEHYRNASDWNNTLKEVTE